MVAKAAAQGFTLTFVGVSWDQKRSWWKATPSNTTVRFTTYLDLGSFGDEQEAAKVKGLRKRSSAAATERPGSRRQQLAAAELPRGGDSVRFVRAGHGDASPEEAKAKGVMQYTCTLCE